MADQKTSRGFSGALVKLWRGGDYEMTVTGRTEITPNYLRLHFTAKDLLTERAVHPTMWVRGWFPDGGKSHQRGYTLVNPDPAAGTVDVDFVWSHATTGPPARCRRSYARTTGSRANPLSRKLIGCLTVGRQSSKVSWLYQAVAST
jgi:hypothetical protein